MPLWHYYQWSSHEFARDQSDTDGFVYALLRDDSTVFYVGVTTNPIMRHCAHRYKHGPCQMLILESSGGRSRYSDERRWISALSRRFPLLNKSAESTRKILGGRP